MTYNRTTVQRDLLRKSLISSDFSGITYHPPLAIHLSHHLRGHVLIWYDMCLYVVCDQKSLRPEISVKFSVNFRLKQFHHLRSFSVVQVFCCQLLFWQRMASLAKIMQNLCNIKMNIMLNIWLILQFCQICLTKLPYFDWK